MSEAARVLPEAVSALPPRTRLGEFEVKSLLGVGGFGIVYLALDHDLEREVAIKEYMPASMAGRTETLHVSLRSQSDAEVFALGLRSFVNEAKLLARFDHPSLIKVHRFWEANGTAYMAMPVLRGRTLKDIRRSTNRAPDEAWIRTTLTPLLGALELLHSEGVYHRDIAPDNIHLESDGRPVLLDFGAARRVITGKTQTLTAILKPAYAPIEQYAETGAVKQGPWTDIYALGATLHFMLLGYPPAPATARTVADESSGLTAQTAPGISAHLLGVIEWMLAPRPADRPQSIAALRNVLEGRSPLLYRPAAPPPPTAGWEKTTIAPPLGPQPVTVPLSEVLPTDLEIDVTAPPPRQADPQTTRGRPGQRAMADAMPMSADDAHRLPPPASRSRLLPVALVGVAVVAALGYFGWSRFAAPANEAAAGAASAPSSVSGAATSTPSSPTPPAPATATTTAVPAGSTPATEAASPVAASASGAAQATPAGSPPATASTGPAGSGGAAPGTGPTSPSAGARPQSKPPQGATTTAVPSARPTPAAPAERPTATGPTAAPPGSAAPQHSTATGTNTGTERAPNAAPGPATAGPAATSPRPTTPGAPAQPAPASSAEPGPTATPEGTCSGRNPLSYFLCMERECLRARFRSHPECQAWRQQSRQRESAGG